LRRLRYAQILLVGHTIAQIAQRGLSLRESDGLCLVGQPHRFDRDRVDRLECVAQDGTVRW